MSESSLLKNGERQGSSGDSNVVIEVKKIEPNLLLQSSKKVEKKANNSSDSGDDSSDEDEMETMDVKKDIVRKAFYKWTFQEVCKMILQEEYPEPDFLPEFKIDELGEERMELNPEEYQYSIGRIASYTRICVVDPASCKAAKTGLLNYYFQAAWQYMKEKKNISTKMGLLAQLRGSCAFGVTDFGFYYNNNIFLIAEIKIKDYNKAITQAIVQMHIAMEAYRARNDLKKNLQAMYGIVSDGFNWRFLKYTWKDTKVAKVKISKTISTPNDRGVTKDHHSFGDIFDWIMRIFEVQIKNLSDV